MKQLKIPYKTGFRVKDRMTPIIINDDRGILFYSTAEMTPKVTAFNLPEGMYTVLSGDFVPMSLPRMYAAIPMPFQDRFFRPNPDSFDIKFGNNPNKCSVIWDKKTILFDNSFIGKPRPQLDFILGHEKGHRYFKDDENCDLYAANYMLKIGYNPSQIGNASIYSLSDNATPRKELLIENL